MGGVGWGEIVKPKAWLHYRFTEAAGLSIAESFPLRFFDRGPRIFLRTPGRRYAALKRYEKRKVTERSCNLRVNTLSGFLWHRAQFNCFLPLLANASRK